MSFVCAGLHGCEGLHAYAWGAGGRQGEAFWDVGVPGSSLLGERVGYPWGAVLFQAVQPVHVMHALSQVSPVQYLNAVLVTQVVQLVVRGRDRS